MANTDAQGAPKPPPNLRVSDDESRECESCVHYQGGRCDEYPAVGHVDGEWVCDSYEKGREDPDDDQPSGAKNLREATRVAYVRVRAHNRRAKQARSDGNAGKPDADDRVK